MQHIREGCAKKGTGSRVGKGTTDLTQLHLFSQGSWISVLQLTVRTQHESSPRRSQVLTYLCSGDNSHYVSQFAVMLSLHLFLSLPLLPLFPCSHVPPLPPHRSNKIVSIPPLFTLSSHWNVTTPISYFWPSFVYATYFILKNKQTKPPPSIVFICHNKKVSAVSTLFRKLSFSFHAKKGL